MKPYAMKNIAHSFIRMALFIMIGWMLLITPAFANEGGGGDRTSVFDNLRSQQSGIKKASPQRIKRVGRKKVRKKRARRRTVRRKRTRAAPQKLDVKWLNAPLQERYVPREILVEISDDAPLGARKIARQFKLRLLAYESNRLLASKIAHFAIPDRRDVRQVAAKLAALKGVSATQPNYLFSLQDTKQNVKARSRPSLQYAVKQLRILQAHKLATGSKIPVAIIDSGIEARHKEIRGSIIGAFNAIAHDKNSAHDHGTAMAGVIAAHSQLTGIAPGARILAVRAFAPAGKLGTALSTSVSLLKALDWAHAKGARIYNLSFAGPRDPLFLKALDRIHDAGGVIIAAAGNGGPQSPPFYPAASKSVIAVTAIDEKDELFANSNTGDHIALSASGVGILAPAARGRYDFVTGTSIAAAHISGIAALILERRPELDPSGVERVLLSAARDLGPAGQDERFGAGCADAKTALEALSSP